MEASRGVVLKPRRQECFRKYWAWFSRDTGFEFVVVMLDGLAGIHSRKCYAMRRHRLGLLADCFFIAEEGARKRAYRNRQVEISCPHFIDWSISLLDRSDLIGAKING